MEQDSQTNPEWFSSHRFASALVLIAIGGIFLLSNFNLLHGREVWDYWPVILMIYGAFRLADSPGPQGRASGGIMLALGAMFLANNLGLFPFNVWDMWPLLLIGWGIYMLIERSASPNPFGRWGNQGPWVSGFHGPRERDWGPGVRRGKSGNQESAVFSGGKRRVTDEDFRSAKYDAVFGGFEIDLRSAQIQGDSATIEVNAVFGGIEVKVPLNWSVVMRGAGVFGGFADSTEQPNPAVVRNIKQLFVRGAAVFGGVEIKN